MNTQLRPSPLVIASGEGLGNSFWLASAAEVRASIREEDEVADAPTTGAATSIGDYARYWCRGDLARDGLLLIHDAVEGVQRVEVYNRDGSDGGTCLNGLRVVALWTGAAEGCLEMAGRRIPWRRMAMPAMLDPEQDEGLALNPGEELIELLLSAETLPKEMWQPQSLEVMGLPAYAVQFWNPHCVIDTPEPTSLYLPAFAKAARERTDLFPEGVNIEIVRFADLTMRVDERGVGETQACGSGAVAVAIATWARDRELGVPDSAGGSAAPVEGEQQPLTVRMPGGNLSLERTSDGGIRLVGGATVSRFDGN